jgi:hypothetical protein
MCGCALISSPAPEAARSIMRANPAVVNGDRSGSLRSFLAKGRHPEACRAPEPPLRSISSAMLDSSSPIVLNAPFASTSKEFRAALLQRSASSRRRVGYSGSGMEVRSRLEEGLGLWCEARATWFDLGGPRSAFRAGRIGPLSICRGRRFRARVGDLAIVDRPTDPVVSRVPSEPSRGLQRRRSDASPSNTDRREI